MAFAARASKTASTPRRREPPGEASIYDGGTLLGTYAGLRERRGTRSLRARDFLGLLSACGRRRAAPAKEANSAGADAAVAPSTFPIEAYNAALDKLVKIAVECGARQEQARMAAIAKLPQAARFPRLAHPEQRTHRLPARSRGRNQQNRPLP